VSTALLQVAEATTRAAGVDQVLSTVVRITPMLSAWIAAQCYCGMDPERVPSRAGIRPHARAV